MLCIIGLSLSEPRISKVYGWDYSTVLGWHSFTGIAATGADNCGGPLTWVWVPVDAFKGINPQRINPQHTCKLILGPYYPASLFLVSHQGSLGNMEGAGHPRWFFEELDHNWGCSHTASEMSSLKTSSLTCGTFQVLSNYMKLNGTKTMQIVSKGRALAPNHCR